jgi:hypothetical protein
VPVLQSGLLWTGLYQSFNFDGSTSIRAGSLTLRPRIRLGWGEDLPLQAGFPLGGDDGFPGLHLGERRGDREAFLGLTTTYNLSGPFLADLELAGGRSAQGGPFLDSDNWLAGIRAGLGAYTPVGPIRVAYGLSNGGRTAVFVRLGRWF